MNRIICVSLALLSIAALCHTAEFTDCGSLVGKFTGVEVSGCDESKAVCELIRGTNATITIHFTTDKDVSKVTAVVHGILMDVPIPFPLPFADACANPNSGITCPLTKDGTYAYKATLPVLEAYPKLSVTVKWELKDEKGQDITCVLIPAKIK